MEIDLKIDVALEISTNGGKAWATILVVKRKELGRG